MTIACLEGGTTAFAFRPPSPDPGPLSVLTPSCSARFVVPHRSTREACSVVGVLRQHVPGVLKSRSIPLSAYKIDLLKKLVACHQPGLGSHAWQCHWCGNMQITYNGCHNRHCCTCGVQKRALWIDRILGWALPIDYLHCVVTLPHEFIPLVLANDRAMFGLLMTCTSQALQQVAEEKHGVKIGLVQTLHTWGQEMLSHPHCHCIVTVGGLASDESSWKSVNATSMFTKEEVANRFRQLFLTGLRQLFRHGKLTMPASMAKAVDEPSLDAWLVPVLRKQWQANVQTAPAHCRGPEAVVKYLAGYVVGSAIRDGRILRHDGKCVVIRRKNYRTGKQEELPMAGEEFVRRFSMHLLPERFLRVRYGGIFRSSQRTERLERCRGLIRPATTLQLDFASEDATLSPVMKELFVDAPHQPDCRRCAMPQMKSVGRRSRHATQGLLSHLGYLFDLLFTFVSTFDVDLSTRAIVSESFDCVGPSMDDAMSIEVACAVVPFACFHDPET